MIMLCLCGVLPNGQFLAVICKCKMLMACLPPYFWDLKESGQDKIKFERLFSKFFPLSWKQCVPLLLYWICLYRLFNPFTCNLLKLFKQRSWSFCMLICNFHNTARLTANMWWLALKVQMSWRGVTQKSISKEKHYGSSVKIMAKTFASQHNRSHSRKNINTPGCALCSNSSF